MLKSQLAITESGQDSLQLNMTALIEVLFDWIESTNPGILSYGSVSFRHALECHYYFLAVNQPSSLLPLLEAASGWRKSTVKHPDTEALQELFDDVSRKSQGKYKHFSLRKMKAIRALLSLYKSKITSGTGTQTTKPPAAERPIAYFGLNERYVSFFSKIIAMTGEQKSVFIPLGNAEARRVAELAKYAVAPDASDKVCLSNIKLSALHPLYIDYLTILNQFLLAIGSLRAVNAGAVVFAEGTSVQDTVLAMAAKQLGVPTLRIQSGRAGVLHSAYRNMPFDTMLVWGQGMAERLKQYTPDANYVLTGNPDIQPAAGAHEQSVKSMFAAGSQLLTVFTQPINPYLSSTDYDLMIQLVDQLLEQNQSLCVLVRKHPVDSCLGFEQIAPKHKSRLKISLSKDLDLQAVIHASDLVLGFYSTTLSESAAYGVPAVLMQLRAEHVVFPYPERYGAAIAVHDVRSALDVIHKILHDAAYKLTLRQNMDKFADYFFGPRDGKAMTRITENILQLALK